MTVAPPTATELQEVLAGEKVVVLIRVTVEKDSKPYPMLDGPNLPDIQSFSFAWSGFDAEGSINTGISRRFLSDETRWQGWIYFLREQRTYFVAIRSGLELGYYIPIEYAPHWRIDVPLNSRLVYAGTLHYMGENKGFWNDRSLAPYKWLMRNEEDLAKEVAARHLPDLGPPLTILMQHTLLWHS